MQHCLIVGNISRINKLKDSNKTFISVADHYSAKNEEGKYEQKTNFVPLEGFIPEGLNLVTGQLVACTFRVTSYKTKDGVDKTANDIIDIDVRLNNISKAKRDEKASAASAASAEAPATEEGEAQTEAPTAPVEEESGSDMPFGASAPAGKKTAK